MSASRLTDRRIVLRRLKAVEDVVIADISNHAGGGKYHACQEYGDGNRRANFSHLVS